MNSGLKEIALKTIEVPNGTHNKSSILPRFKVGGLLERLPEHSVRLNGLGAKNSLMFDLTIIPAYSCEVKYYAKRCLCRKM